MGMHIPGDLTVTKKQKKQKKQNKQPVFMVRFHEISENDVSVQKYKQKCVKILKRIKTFQG